MPTFWHMTSRVPEHEPGLKLNPERLEPPVLKLAQQDADRGAAEFRERLADGGQGGHGDRGLTGVVEPCHRHVSGNVQAAR